LSTLLPLKHFVINLLPWVLLLMKQIKFTSFFMA
jgi:hypothetical protein